MIGISDREFLALRFESFARDVLAPAVTPLRAPLPAEVFQPQGPLSWEEARKAPYRPVEIGFRWGPAWSTAWFRLKGRVPSSMAGRPVALRFSSGTEATLWEDGVPRRGFDPFRDRVLLFPQARGGEEVDLLVEAACNKPLGATVFWWEDREVHKRWAEEKPGRLEACELVVLDPPMERFLAKYEFARKTALALPEESPRWREILLGLREITAGIDAAAPRETALPLERDLEALLAGGPARPATTCIAVGHAHIDTAWLWPLRETRRKLLRTWSNVLESMEEFPEFRFLASQAQHYAFVEEDSPALFEKVRARVLEGRWEAGGAMWVEADCNCPSGESLVRQILLGTTYWRERFGDAALQRFLWLPDTFGFPASLPQIMKLAGLETFLTNKMSWCEWNRFPFTTFRWRGIDGTEVLAHLTPGEDYNAALEPAELLRGERRLLSNDTRPVGPRRSFLETWLQPFGYGDGGGGPTRESILRARLAGKVQGLPRVEAGRVDDFCRALEERRRKILGEGGPDLPAWDGELYMENHRGTLTSQAWIKAANARMERRLRTLEALAAALPEGHRAAGKALPRLEDAWKTLLLHQFHDILPGSSIAEVYDQARQAFSALDSSLAEMEEELLTALEESLFPSIPGEGILLFNPCSSPRSGPVREEGITARAREIPPLSLAFLPEGPPSPSGHPPVKVEGRRMENGILRVEIDEGGNVGLLERIGASLPVNPPAPQGGLLPLGTPAFYEDRPRRWEAWNLDFDYTDKEIPPGARPPEIRILEEGPSRAAFEVRQKFRSSEITRTYILEEGSPRLDVECRVDWREERTIFRILFPTRIRASHAVYGIQFGHVERPTHRNTSWEEARFEVPGHGWMDLSQPGLGLAVLDDGTKFGRSCLEGTLGLTLLRSPRFPDPGADRGVHRFRYALLPHLGDWRRARVPEEAEALGDPLRAWKAAPPPEGGGAGGETAVFSPFRIESLRGGFVEIAAFKPARSGRGKILRLVERHGRFQEIRIRWARPLEEVLPVDLLERPAEEEGFRRSGDTEVVCRLRPFQILTLLVLESSPRKEGEDPA